MEYASNGKGNLGVTLGAVGTGLSLLNGNGLGGLFGGLGGSNTSMDFIDVKTENAILKSELNTERKILDIYNDLNDKITVVSNKVDSNAAAQAVINCGFNSATSVLQTQVAQLMGMTKTVIPNANICPGWDTTTTSTT